MSSMAFYAEIGQPFTEDDMPPPPTHCRCGRLLLRRYETDGYTKTGRLDRFPTWNCPKMLTRFAIFLGRHVGHDIYAPDRFVHPYWRKREYR